MKNQEIRTFGRVRGKKLSARQESLVRDLLPTLLPGRDNTKTILEIGFGAGEHLLHLARAYPNHTIIGAEPFMNGVAALLSQLANSQKPIANSQSELVKPEYRNIRIWPDDVRKLLSTNDYRLSTDVNFEKIYVLHPDPWPKARHEKRRLLQTDFLRELAARLAPDGQIIFGTDHLDLFDWVVAQARISGLKFLISETPPEDGMTTRYKEKDKFGAGRTRYLVISHAL